MTIPASNLVNVLPGVLGAGGNPLSLNSVFLTQDDSLPIGTVMSFATLEDVQNYFGATAQESVLAGVYFAGFTGSTTLPGTLYFAQYNTTAVAAYLRSGSLAGMTLVQLQAFTGTLTISINGAPITTGSINLSGASSFSNAASLIQSALNTALSGTTCAYDPQLAAFVIKSPTTGAASTIGFATVNAFATGIKLTSAAGAVTSQGADIAVQATFMNAVKVVTQNWATFLTIWEPIDADKLLFAAWVQTQNQRFAYIAWDSSVTPKNGDAPSSFGAVVAAAQDDGVFVVWDTDGKKAAFVAGITASIDFLQTEGRITYAFKGQAGLTPDVTDATTAANLKANGYNFYGAYATANDLFVNLQNGSIAGRWEWFDAYINQIWLNASFQLAYMSYLSQVNSVPYNAQGYSQLRQVALDPINAALNFGAIRPGVTLSAAQRAQVNTAAGLPISTTIEQTGWYLLITPAAPSTRALRESPPMTFWYTDGGSIQEIELSSIDIL